MPQVFKQNKILYYIHGYKNIIAPNKINYKRKIQSLKNKLSKEEIASCEERIHYYCQTCLTQSTPANHIIKDLKKPQNPKAYYFDTYEYARFFDENLKLNFAFGDVTHVPEFPAIVKSRPICDDNQNSVLLKLDKPRHFVWIKDDIPFEKKKDLMIGRGGIYQEHRYKFFEQYFNNPLCDLGQVNEVGGGKSEWIKPKISIEKHLSYKFILSLQGNDVASNLKWIMSSNSIAVMPKPTVETWFMEGTLIAGVHYIEIKNDYSNLEEQLNYYINHPEKCLEIIKNANEYCKKFQNKIMEDYCSFRVLEKYFDL
ncbi:lipopolysaccharide biosynthesis protein [Weeksellaceae bacterium TAE3-ERU29]|nr:lipopolysaccharide biosynthesis protein [Weeksellaceae bacterium TAE3-ERU29]